MAQGVSLNISYKHLARVTLSGDALRSTAGRASLMETRGPGYRGNRYRENVPSRPCGSRSQGFSPCSRAGNTPLISMLKL